MFGVHSPGSASARAAVEATPRRHHARDRDTGRAVFDGIHRAQLDIQVLSRSDRRDERIVVGVACQLVQVVALASFQRYSVRRWPEPSRPLGRSGSSPYIQSSVASLLPELNHSAKSVKAISVGGAERTDRRRTPRRLRLTFSPYPSIVRTYRRTLPWGNWLVSTVKSPLSESGQPVEQGLVAVASTISLRMTCTVRMRSTGLHGRRRLDIERPRPRRSRLLASLAAR